MIGGITFREAIENNKKHILFYLKMGKKSTSDICKNYCGEHEMLSVRKALNELRKEGSVTTDDKVHMWEGKFWELVISK